MNKIRCHVVVLALSVLVAQSAVADDNLRLGHTVIADSVNPVPATRDAWLEVANRMKVTVVEVEVKCSDRLEHRRRVEQRLPEEPSLNGPTWQDLVSRDYRDWDRDHIVVDTAGRTIEQTVSTLLSALAAR